MYIVLDSMYVTVSISTGLYPKLDLWKANKLHYITSDNLYREIIAVCSEIHTKTHKYTVCTEHGGFKC